MKRRLAAILAADIAGYSRLMGEDEAATVRDLKGHQAVVLPLVGRYGGRIIDTAGDGILAEFPSVINATECAVEIQTIMATRNEGVPESRRMRFRIGINQTARPTSPRCSRGCACRHSCCTRAMTLAYRSRPVGAWRPASRARGS